MEREEGDVEMVRHLSKGPSTVHTAAEYHAVSSGNWEEAEGVLGLPWELSGKNPPTMQETQVQSLELGRSRGEGYGHQLQHSLHFFIIFYFFHFNILAWRIPWTEEPGGLQFIGLHRVRYE